MFELYQGISLFYFIFFAEMKQTQKSSIKEDRRKIKNCKADNIAEKLFRIYWKQDKSSLCKKHLYQGLSLNSWSVDVGAIKNALLKHQQIYLKIPTVGGVQVFTLELHPQFHFLGFFLLGTPIFGNTWVFFVLFFFFDCNVSHSLCFCFFLQKIRQPVLFSTS